MKEAQGIFMGISGKVGNVVFVQRGKKTYVRSLPSKRKSAYTKEERVKQSYFGLASRIASRICQIEEIKHFWKPIVAQNRSSYNRIFKANFNQFDIKNFKGYISLSSEMGFNLNKPSLKMSKTELQIECGQLMKSDIDYNNKVKYFIVAGIIILRGPTQKGLPAYEIMSFKSEKMLISPDSLVDVKIVFSGDDLKNWNGYLLRKAFATLITSDGLGKPLRNSQIIMSKP
jgi:hypothetical protein